MVVISADCTFSGDRRTTWHEAAAEGQLSRHVAVHVQSAPVHAAGAGRQGSTFWINRRSRMMGGMMDARKHLLLIQPPFYRFYDEGTSLVRSPLLLPYLAGAVQEDTGWSVGSARDVATPLARGTSCQKMNHPRKNASRRPSAAALGAILTRRCSGRRSRGLFPLDR